MVLIALIILLTTALEYLFSLIAVAAASTPIVFSCVEKSLDCVDDSGMTDGTLLYNVTPHGRTMNTMGDLAFKKFLSTIYLRLHLRNSWS